MPKKWYDETVNREGLQRLPEWQRFLREEKEAKKFQSWQMNEEVAALAVTTGVNLLIHTQVTVMVYAKNRINEYC